MICAKAVSQPFRQHFEMLLVTLFTFHHGLVVEVILHLYHSLHQDTLIVLLHSLPHLLQVRTGGRAAPVSAVTSTAVSAAHLSHIRPEFQNCGGQRRCVGKAAFHCQIR